MQKCHGWPSLPLLYRVEGWLGNIFMQNLTLNICQLHMLWDVLFWNGTNSPFLRCGNTRGVTDCIEFSEFHSYDGPITSLHVHNAWLLMQLTLCWQADKLYQIKSNLIFDTIRCAEWSVKFHTIYQSLIWISCHLSWSPGIVISISQVYYKGICNPYGFITLSPDTIDQSGTLSHASPPNCINAHT